MQLQMRRSPAILITMGTSDPNGPPLGHSDTLASPPSLAGLSGGKIQQDPVKRGKQRAPLTDRGRAQVHRLPRPRRVKRHINKRESDSGKNF